MNTELFYQKAFSEDDGNDTQYYKGVCYTFGYGVDVDLDKAKASYCEGVDKKNVKCMYGLAVLLLKSKMTEDKVKANSLFSAAFKELYDQATMNDPISQRMVSCYYLFGDRGVDQNLVEAKNWLQKAAQNGDAEAQMNLAHCYEVGDVFRKDINLALKWYAKSASQGNVSSSKKVAKLRTKANTFAFEDHPNYSVKEPKLLYIDRYGNIYPDCKTYKTPILCHITDSNAAEIVNKHAFGSSAIGIFNMITIEVSSMCNARCFYCFQSDAHRNEKYEYYDYLLPFLDKVTAYWVFFSGGEILIQDDAMSFIRKYRSINPNTWIHLKTNGHAGAYEAAFVEEVCDSIMVSFNGFSSTSYKTIMGIDLDKTKSFCESIKSGGKTNLGVKLLNSPITVAETPEFLEWALSLKPKCIAIQNAYNYDVEPSGKNRRLSCTLPKRGHSLYWDSVYNIISERCNNTLERHYKDINNGCNYLTADKGFISLLDLSAANRPLFRTDGVYVIE